MHTVFALLCFVVVIHWLIFPYPSGLLHWHCGNLTIAPVPAKQPWWIWINTSCEFIMNDCITTTKQSTTKPCAYFLGYTVHVTTCQYVLSLNKCNLCRCYSCSRQGNLCVDMPFIPRCHDFFFWHMVLSTRALLCMDQLIYTHHVLVKSVSLNLYITVIANIYQNGIHMF